MTELSSHFPPSAPAPYTFFSSISAKSHPDRFATGFYHTLKAADTSQQAKIGAVQRTEWTEASSLQSTRSLSSSSSSGPAVFPAPAPHNVSSSSQGAPYTWTPSTMDASMPSMVPHTSPHERPLSFDSSSAAYIQSSSGRGSTPASDSISSGASDFSVTLGSSRTHSVSDLAYSGFPSSSAAALPIVPLDPASGHVQRAKAARSGRGASYGMPEDQDDRDGGSDSAYETARKKKKDYAKNFRDTEKLHFEELRKRLFPRDPHARRAECLEKAIEWIDELAAVKAREMQRAAEISSLRQQLAAAEQRAHLLEVRLKEAVHPPLHSAEARYEPPVQYQQQQQQSRQSIWS